MSQEQKNDDFWAALSQKDFAKAEALLKDGAEIEQTNLRGETPLIFFSLNKNIEVAEWLVAHRANINAKDLKGETALLKAIETREREVFDWVLSKSPDLEAKNTRGSTAIMQAANLKNKGFLEELIRRGADVNASFHGVGGALLNAAGRGSIEIMDALIDAGADVNAVDSLGCNVLQAAIRNEEPTAALHLLEKSGEQIDLEHKAKSGATPLSYAADSGHVEIIGWLIDHGVDPNVISSNRMNDSRTPLMVLAALPKGLNYIEGALAAGADVNAVDAEGNNVLFYVSQAPEISIEAPPAGSPSGMAGFPGMAGVFSSSGDAAALQSLIKYGVDLSVPTGKSGMTLVHRALIAKKADEREAMLAELLKMGFPASPALGTAPGAPDDEIQPLPTPLIMTVLRKDLPSMNLLLQFKADPNQLDSHGMGPLHHLASVGFSQKEQIAIHLFAKQKKMDKETLDKQVADLQEKNKELCSAILDKLVTSGADVNLPGAGGETPLLTFVKQNQLPMVKVLINQYGADPLKCNELGDDALVTALKCGHKEMYEELVYIYDKRGFGVEAKSVVLNATFSSPEGWEHRARFTQMLRDAKPSKEQLEYRDNDGNTPLIVAAATDQDDLVNALLELGADPNAVNALGETALVHAVLQENVQIIQALRFAKADMNQKMNNGKTVFQMANAISSPSVFRALHSALQTQTNSEPDRETVEAALGDDGGAKMTM